MRISDWSSDVCSSDLARGDDAGTLDDNLKTGTSLRMRRAPARQHHPAGGRQALAPGPKRPPGAPRKQPRSEEHTSEIQSLMRNPYAVFCVNKKQKPTTTKQSYNMTLDHQEILNTID